MLDHRLNDQDLSVRLFAPMGIKYGEALVSILSVSCLWIVVSFFNCVSMIYKLKLLLGLSPFLTEQEVFDSPSRTA